MSRLDSIKRVMVEITKGTQVIKRNWKLITLGVFIIAAATFAIYTIANTFPDNGIGEFNKPSYNYYRPAKTLWDLLSLLVVPLGLGLVGAVFGYWLNSYQKRREDQSQANRFQEETLQQYLDVMTRLMLEWGLRNDNTSLSPHVQNIARHRTLTVLRELDGKRKAIVLRFLYESQLIGGFSARAQRVLDLKDADFSKAELSGTKLSEACLESINFDEADLSGANLSGADLFGARFNRADLRRATLSEANFLGAYLTYADLTGAIDIGQALKASDLKGIRPVGFENSLNRQQAEPVAKPDSKDWLTDTDWLKMTEIISHKRTTEYHDDGNEKHGEWVVTRGEHRIEPLEDFCLGIYLVTNEFFFQFVRDKGYDRVDEFWERTPSQSKAQFLCQDGKSFGPSTWPSIVGFLKGQTHHPVAGISYYEASAFCRWLQKEHPKEGWTWRLPTENMWERVARPEEDFLYPWGPKFEPDRCNSVEAQRGATTAIGFFQEGKSRDGCFDMAGNLWEFVREDEGEHWYCVLRGGSYRNSAAEVKSSLRLWGVPRDHRPPDFGFRCALVRGSA